MASQNSGLDAWLRYAPLPIDIQKTCKLYPTIFALSNEKTSPVFTAAKELQKGLQGILNQKTSITSESNPSASGIIVGTVEAFKRFVEEPSRFEEPQEDGFWLSTRGETVRILGQNERGALYGAFEFLRRLGKGDFSEVEYCSNPSGTIRWVNQWDNLDGSIERGYGGKSIFFRDMKVLDDLIRAEQYARLLSSIGLNGCVINNVNSHPHLLSDENMKGLARVADIMRPYGIQVGVALNFDSPKGLGGLPTSDPLDPAVIEWWNDITTKLYGHIPDLIGYTIKANSEGQPGPLTYGRTLADAANMFGRALKPHGDGLVLYRAFVYDHHLDESNWKNDRANAAVEYFKEFDDEFDENVVIQIKFGPIDFQIREPPSPLFANLRKTNAVIEFMVAQEYLGQQSHLVYIAPEWKTILDFDLRIDGQQSYIRDLLSGQRLGWKNSGYVAVVNVGNDQTWLGSHLAMLNLYSYGRLAWEPLAEPEQIAQDWAKLTFGVNDKVVNTIVDLSMDSWPAYEGYSGNLGIQTLCDILGTHFGPCPASQDGNGWGQWTRADSKALGMDRTLASGTGNAAQYPPEVAKMFENIDTTPDDLLLWFHHVPYTHRLKSGNTVIQHFYDAHYSGCSIAQTFPERWVALKGLIDDARFNHILFRLRYQADHSRVWRDGICEFYRAKCGIDDEKIRVRNHKWRIAAKDMDLDGYEIMRITQPEMASEGQAIVVQENCNMGIAQSKMPYPSGSYDVGVNYYDHLGGKSEYAIFINGTSIGSWKSNLEDELGHDFSDKPDGASAIRITFSNIQIAGNATVKIVGKSDGRDRAPLDYVSFVPHGSVD